MEPMGKRLNPKLYLPGITYRFLGVLYKEMGRPQTHRCLDEHEEARGSAAPVSAGLGPQATCANTLLVMFLFLDLASEDVFLLVILCSYSTCYPSPVKILICKYLPRPSIYPLLDP